MGGVEMANKKYVVELTTGERANLLELVSKNKANRAKIVNAYILTTVRILPVKLNAVHLRTYDLCHSWLDQESRPIKNLWIPAFAGMTLNDYS